MLLVNITHSYPVDQIAEANTEGMLLPFASLVNASAGDWPHLSTQYLSDNADYIAATTSVGHIVGIFRVKDADWITDEQGTSKVRFMLEPAPEAAHHVGAPMPGGPWRRGEARGTRAVPTPTDFLPVSDLTTADSDIYYRRIYETAVAHSEGRLATSPAITGPRAYGHSDTSWIDRAVVGGADVRAYRDGVIHVFAPADTRVIVETGSTTL